MLSILHPIKREKAISPFLKDKEVVSYVLFVFLLKNKRCYQKQDLLHGIAWLDENL